LSWTRALLLDVPVGGAEGETDQVGSEIRQEKVLLFGVVADCLELDVVVDLVCYLIVVVLWPELPTLENTLVQDEKLYYHHAVGLQH
jgi:hypothetical protein